MKKIFSALLIGLFTFTFTTVSHAQTDAKAKAILDKVSKKVRSFKALQANFSLSLSSANGKVNQKKTGSFIMQGAKYKVNLSGQEIICDNKSIWTYNKDAQEIQVSTYEPGEQTISPAKLLTGSYDKDYKYQYSGTKKIGGKTVDVITLQPTNRGKQLSKVELMVDKASSMIVSANIWEKNGTKYVYAMSKFTPNPKIAANTFTYVKSHYPANVEVIDLR